MRDTAAYGVCLRDLEAVTGQPERPGILAAVRGRNCPGLRSKPGHPFIGPAPLQRLSSQAIEQAGHPQQGTETAGQRLSARPSYRGGPGHRDWEASHVQNIGVAKRRIRLYLVENEATAEEREMIRRAARRDFQLTEALQHPGVLRALGYTEHEVGPAIVFEHDPMRPETRPLPRPER